MSAYKLIKTSLVKAEKYLILSQVCKFNDIISTRFSLKILQCGLYTVQRAPGAHQLPTSFTLDKIILCPEQFQEQKRKHRKIPVIFIGEFKFLRRTDLLT